MATNLSKLSLEALADLQVPKELHISPDGSQVVYTLEPSYSKKDKDPVSSLWIADIGKKDSARQVTSGLYKDELPRWSPDGKHIAFVSDRANRGKCSTVYLMAMKTLGGEPFPITDPQHEKQIVSFEWSLNGAFIAFLSENEKTAEKKRKEEEKDDAKVYGTDWNYQRLRLIHVETRQVTTMVQGDQHVNSFSWSRDSKLIAYTVHQIPDINSAALHGCEIHILNLATRATRSFFSFSGPIKSLVWGSPEFIYFIAGVTPKKSTTSSCVYRLNVKTEELNTYFGITDCAMALCDGRQCVIVRVQSAESDMLYALGPWETPLSRLHQSLCDITAFDVLWDPKDDRFIISNTVSNASEPDEVSAVEVHGGQRSFRGQLSCHNTAISALGLSVSRQIFACAPDGQQSDGILFTPQTPGPYPTVVMVHGGPYYRVTQSFAVCHYLEVPLLTAAGYAVLCPNYRGSSGRGEEFAASSHGGMGTADYMDVIAVLKKAIKEKLVDETRVAIGGWSQGGFLSYLAVTREDFQFKAAVCGAGVVDWDMLTMTSDAHAFEADLAGGAPWDGDYIPRRDGSPIWNMKNVKTPILILHGEEDERVPLSQAIAFWRGCQRWKVPVEMVTYPREKHRVQERKHVIDMWERIRRFYDLHLK